MANALPVDRRLCKMCECILNASPVDRRYWKYVLVNSKRD